jgi:hypothetical protein
MKRPKLRKVTGKKKARRLLEKEVSEKINMFDRMPEMCLSCDDPFDKTNEEMVKTWTVVIRKEEEKVNLWCPTCWDNAKNILQDFLQKKEENEVQPG